MEAFSREITEFGDRKQEYFRQIKNIVDRMEESCRNGTINSKQHMALKVMLYLTLQPEEETTSPEPSVVLPEEA